MKKAKEIEIDCPNCNHKFAIPSPALQLQSLRPRVEKPCIKCGKLFIGINKAKQCIECRKQYNRDANRINQAKKRQEIKGGKNE